MVRQCPPVSGLASQRVCVVNLSLQFASYGRNGRKVWLRSCVVNESNVERTHAYLLGMGHHETNITYRIINPVTGETL